MNLSPPDTTPVVLVLRDLGAKRQPATCITPDFGRALAEAASVCLDERGHTSPTKMDVAGDIEVPAHVDWDAPSDQSRRCWNDDEVATEHGA